MLDKYATIYARMVTEYISSVQPWQMPCHHVLYTSCNIYIHNYYRLKIPRIRDPISGMESDDSRSESFVINHMYTKGSHKRSVTSIGPKFSSSCQKWLKVFRATFNYFQTSRNGKFDNKMFQWGKKIGNGKHLL